MNYDEDNRIQVKKPPIPILTVKEKKELVSYALSLGKSLKTQQVGKSGVTPSLVSSFLETLEANELLKVYFFTSSFFISFSYMHRTIPTRVGCLGFNSQKFRI